MPNQFQLQGPRSQHPTLYTSEYTQPEPGLDSALLSQTDRCERSYGDGCRLRGNKALIAGSSGGYSNIMRRAFGRRPRRRGLLLRARRANQESSYMPSEVIGRHR